MPLPYKILIAKRKFMVCMDRRKAVCINLQDIQYSYYIHSMFIICVCCRIIAENFGKYAVLTLEKFCYRM